MSDTYDRVQVPVTIVTGFLGAGKTSLLNHVLSGDHGRSIAVVVNDFGSVNIDAGLIENRDGDVVSLENGCICCSLSAGLLASAVQLVRRRPPPEHILIEASGISDPHEVARTFSDPELQRYAPLEGVVTVVDAELAPTLENQMQDLARHQVRAADITILNKIDLVGEPGRRDAREWVTCHAPNSRVIEATHGRVPVELLFGIGGASEVSKASLPEGTAHLQAFDQSAFETYLYETDDPLPMSRLHAVLSHLPKGIFRAKGVVNLVEKPDHPCVLQSTGKRAVLTVGQPWGDKTPTTQIVFIGLHGEVDGQWLERQLAGTATSVGTDL